MACSGSESRSIGSAQQAGGHLIAFARQQLGKRTCADVAIPRTSQDPVDIGAEGRLLETASDPIDQVRRHVGYSDPAAFRRIFKGATGLSPGAYRHAYGPRNGPGAVT
jgi:AraC-like DNA-binding protein